MHDISINEKVFARNDAIAQGNREYFNKKGLFVVNLVSSPGSGKTRLIEKTLDALSGEIKCAVIVGDIQTDNDARRIGATGVAVKQITTGRSCHLDALMISHTLPWLDEIEDLELLLIENVGNLVCPSDFLLGEDCMISLLSVTEGEDKPLKYPFIFRKSDAMIINKTDLLPYTDFDMDEVKKNASIVNPCLKYFETSCATGMGLSKWLSWLRAMASK